MFKKPSKKVLSERAIKQLAKSSGDGSIIDPHNDKRYDLNDIIYMNIGFTLDDEKEFEEMKKKLRKRREAKKLAKAEKRKTDGVSDEMVSLLHISFFQVKIIYNLKSF